MCFFMKGNYLKAKCYCRFPYLTCARFEITPVKYTFSAKQNSWADSQWFLQIMFLGYLSIISFSIKFSNSEWCAVHRVDHTVRAFESPFSFRKLRSSGLSQYKPEMTNSSLVESPLSSDIKLSAATWASRAQTSSDIVAKVTGKNNFGIYLTVLFTWRLHIPHHTPHLEFEVTADSGPWGHSIQNYIRENLVIVLRCCSLVSLWSAACLQHHTHF